MRTDRPSIRYELALSKRFNGLLQGNAIELPKSIEPFERTTYFSVHARPIELFVERIGDLLEAEVQGSPAVCRSAGSGLLPENLLTITLNDRVFIISDPAPPAYPSFNAAHAANRRFLSSVAEAIPAFSGYVAELWPDLCPVISIELDRLNASLLDGCQFLTKRSWRLEQSLQTRLAKL